MREKSNNKFSVLISVYENDSPEYFNEALCSIWDEQTLKPDEIVLVQDGPVTAELEAVIVNWAKKIENKLVLVRLDKNVGLGKALNKGLQHCSYDYVARMDSDDISLPQRFSAQMEFLKQHPEIDVLGAWIDEYDQTMKNRLFSRTTPLNQENIKKEGLRKNPINHVSVFFKKNAVLGVGGYPEQKKAQDYCLWALMLVRGYTFANIPLVLVNVRTGDDFWKRRGLNYLKHEIDMLNFQRKIGFLNPYYYLTNLVMRCIARSIPAPLKKAAYILARKSHRC